jgi:hypothetical protein
VRHLNTSHLIGIVALWSRDNLLVFEEEVIKFESDTISGIVGFTDRQIIVEDVFGVVQLIDLATIEPQRKVVRSSPLRVSFSNLKLSSIHLLPGATVTKPAYVDPLKVLSGIGLHSQPNRFYETKFDKSEKMTSVIQRIASRPGVPSPSPITFKLQGNITPVFVRNRHGILFIGENPITDHFGPLIYRFNGKNTKIEDSALWFLPLRMAKN